MKPKKLDIKKKLTALCELQGIHWDCFGDFNGEWCCVLTFDGHDLKDFAQDTEEEACAAAVVWLMTDGKVKK